MSAITTNLPPIWDGTCGQISGSTPYGYFDNDVQFQTDGPLIARYVTRKLGFPIVDIEIGSGSVFACFEDAICKYSEEVNKINITNNIYGSIGAPTGSDFTGKVINPTLGNIIRIADNYGQETNVGGNIDIKRGYFDLVDNQQRYDLQALWANVSESGKRIEIRKMYHVEPSAITRYYDPTVGTGVGISNMLGEFGWDRQFSPAVTFLIQPIYADILRLQQIELNSTIRKSNYSFNLVNNKVDIFPVPSLIYATRVYFDYVVTEDHDNPLQGYLSGSENSGKVTDASNIPYSLLTYQYINSVGKNWIKEYTYVLSKEVLGLVRSKYATVPSPNGELKLDGETLRTEASKEKETLLKDLDTFLDITRKENQMKIQKENTQNLNDTLGEIPLGIYIG